MSAQDYKTILFLNDGQRTGCGNISTNKIVYININVKFYECDLYECKNIHVLIYLF